MKLLHKTNKFYGVAALLVFLMGGIIFYFALKFFVNNDIVEKLYEEKQIIEKQIASLDSIPQLVIISGDIVKITKVAPEIFTSNVITKDTIQIDEEEAGEKVPSRLIAFYAQSKFNTYQITITKSLVESDDLIEVIAIALAALIVSFFIALYFVNRTISKFIWTSFYESLDKIKQFDVTHAKQLNILPSDINEFNELNKSVTLMTDKIQTDYKNLKEFTENASHEIQTPLAIIKTKLELLIQSESLNEEQMVMIQSVYDATNRLSKLNRSLILLSKIENNQFGQKEKINFSEAVKKHIVNFTELIEAKKLTLNTSIKNNIIVNINSSLADVLITNLITNAIKHNNREGEINIELTDQHFKISNTGFPLKNNPIELFNRFKKDKSSGDSLGLGLSIVKKIVETMDYEVSYSFQNNRHIVELVFQNETNNTNQQT
ncbi:MAG: HAMP domain-containing sensor histidine kinase [Bacteroidia bacterium]